jgi:hypothetical protein
MNGKEILIDTNIVLYLLKGNDTLEEMLQGKNLISHLLQNWNLWVSRIFLLKKKNKLMNY